MSRLEALRALLAKPLDHPDQQRIGRRVLYATPDTRVWIVKVVRVLRRIG